MSRFVRAAQGPLKVIAYIDVPVVIEKILTHLGTKAPDASASACTRTRAAPPLGSLQAALNSTRAVHCAPALIINLPLNPQAIVCRCEPMATDARSARGGLFITKTNKRAGRGEACVAT